MGHPCNCTHPLTEESGKLNANPDVAGIGILVGLTLPALATFVLLLIYYLSAVEHGNIEDMWTELDVAFLKWLRKKHPHWSTNQEALEKVILSFSDAQLVNAFSLLFGAFTIGCNMDPYHWQIMVQCVWFTSATHLATIPILRAQLYSKRDTDNRFLIYLRATLMTLVLGMLVSSLVPTGHPYWLFGSYDHPREGVTLSALCFFDYNFPAEDGPYVSRMSAFGAIWLSWSIALATVTFLKRLLELVRPPKRKTSREPRLRTVKTSTNKPIRIFTIIIFFWDSFQETWRTVWRLLNSFGGHIFWLFIMLSWNLYLLIYNKWYFQLVEDGADNKWSFGQTTPLVLFILPAMTIVEEYFSANAAKNKRSTDNSQTPESGFNNETYNESTRISVFLMFEFLLLFALLASINFTSTIPDAGSASGAGFLSIFLALVLIAPLVFTCIIHLADNFFKWKGLKKKTLRNSIVATIVALCIGVAISWYFVQEYLYLFEWSVSEGVPPFQLQGSNDGR